MEKQTATPRVEQYDDEVAEGRWGYRVTMPDSSSWDVVVTLDPVNLRYSWQIANARPGMPEYQAGGDDLQDSAQAALDAAVRFLEAQRMG